MDDELLHDEALRDFEDVKRFGFRAFIPISFPLVDPNPYVGNWHIDAGAELLQAVYDEEIRNLLLLWPPGTMKSLLVSTLFPAWVWSQDPTLKFITATYEQGLSEKNAKLHRDLVVSDWFARRWGHMCRITHKESQKVRMFENTSMGFRFSTSVGGPLTGRHGDILLGDDLVRGQAADGENQKKFTTADLTKANNFWTRTMPTRQSNPKRTRKLMIAQRLHHNDPPSQCLKSGEYQVFCLPMEYDPKKTVVIRFRHAVRAKGKKTGKKVTKKITDIRTKRKQLLFPERYGQKEVDYLRKTLGPLDSAAQLDQDPTPPGGNIFKRKWFQHWGAEGPWKELPKTHYLTIVQSWDMTFKASEESDYVSGTVWGRYRRNHFLLDRFYRQADFVDSKKAVQEMTKKWPTTAKILIEDKANGSAVISALSDQLQFIVPVNPEGGKLSRAWASTVAYESESMWHPDPRQVHWVEEFEKNLAEFPYAPNDDDVDSVSQYVINIQATSNRSLEAAMERLYG